MSDTETRLAHFVLNSLKSGKIGIKIGEDEPIRIEVSEESVKVSVPEPLFSGVSFKLLRHRLTDFRLLRRISETLKDSPKRLDLFLDGEKVFSIGKGVSSLFGNEKIYLTNLLRSLRH